MKFYVIIIFFENFFSKTKFSYKCRKVIQNIDFYKINEIGKLLEFYLKIKK